jgi:tetratricopeptide (TPR) repeat protein
MTSFKFPLFAAIIIQGILSYQRDIPRRNNALHMLADITSIVNSPIVMRTVISTLDSVKKNGFINCDDTDDSNINILFGQSIDSTVEEKMETLTSRILHKTNGPVPRSYLPSLMVIDQIDANIIEAAVFAIVEEGMQWYFDTGGRASRIEISCPISLSTVIQSMGFYLSGESEDSDVIQLRNLDVQEGDGRCLLSCDAARFKDHCEKRVLVENTNTYSLYDIIGRLSHDLGDPSGAVKPYTSSLQVNPKSAATFRNMGSAYHAIGDVKLAFACYQQAIELDKSDALVYLKLAFFYEEFATKDWIDAFEHSQRCYQYYLEKVDPDDTAILTRLGNLLVKEFKPVEAIEIYTKVLKLNENLDNVWYNKANAQLSINDKLGAIESFEKVINIDKDNFIASHMLISLSEEKSEKAVRLNNLYVQNLFNDYAGMFIVCAYVNT